MGIEDANSKFLPNSSVKHAGSKQARFGPPVKRSVKNCISLTSFY